MPDRDEPEAPEQPQPPERRFTMVEVRWAAAGALAILFGIFIAQNADQVEVDFILVSAKVRLIWVFLICFVIGGILDRLLQHKGILSRPKSRRED